MSAVHLDAPASRLDASPRAAWLAFTLAVVALSLSLALRGAVNVWLSTGLAALVGVAATLAVARGELLSLLRPSARQVGLGLAAGVLMVLATHALYPLGLALVPGLGERVASLYEELRAPPGPRAAVPLLLLVVFSEELVFRGLLVALLERLGMSRSGVVLAATALYVVPQLAGGSPVLAMLAVACGLVWTAQRVLGGSLVAPLLTHVLWDLAVFVWWPLSNG
jgi:uncharacterized protein